jgi:antitoxin HigA-1
MKHLRPIHPGEYILEDCIKPLGLTITEVAAGLGVTRNSLSRLINGKNGVSPIMAFRLTEAFGSTPEMWMRLQVAYDLDKARRNLPDFSIPRYSIENQ